MKNYIIDVCRSYDPMMMMNGGPMMGQMGHSMMWLQSLHSITSSLTTLTQMIGANSSLNKFKIS